MAQGLEASAKLIYKDLQNDDDPEIIVGEGDGVVTMQNLEGCTRFPRAVDLTQSF